MLSDLDRELFRDLARQVDAKTFTALKRALRALDGTDDQTRAYLLETIRQIMLAHGTMTADLATELYQSARDYAGITTAFTPRPTTTIDTGIVEKSLDWALAPVGGATNLADMTDDALASTLSRLQAVATRVGARAHEDTVIGNLIDDPEPARMRRVPAPGACPWCLMLATRGFVYTEATVTRTSSGTKYHDRCKCVAEPQFDGEGTPELVRRAERAWTKSKGMEDFAVTVHNGGLGDRPKPGRTADGEYRPMTTGEKVPFTRKAIEVSLFDDDKQSGIWYGSKADGIKPKAPGAPAGYSRKDFSQQVRETLKNPARIKPGDEPGTYVMEQTFDTTHVEVVVGPGTGSKPYRVIDATPTKR